MPNAPDTLTGRSLKWTGRHHSESGDFADLSTHIVHYLTASDCKVTAGETIVGTATYQYLRLDEQMAICIYHPTEYQGHKDVVLNAMFNFAEMTDRAVITLGGAPFAVADGTLEFSEIPEWVHL